MQPSDIELPAQAVAALEQGRLIDAVKFTRQARGLGLKEAKDAVEAYIGRHPHLKMKYDDARAEAKRGCMNWILGITLIGLAAYFLLRGL